MSTATVETLTAEVRVLMVGNRQVTLSVYRQLDRVAVEKLEPFGRVNDGKDEGLWLVGRHAETGALVRGESLKPDWRPWLDEGNLSGSVILCSRDRYNVGRDGYALRHQGRELLADPEVVSFCGVGTHMDHRTGEGCKGWQVNGLEREIVAALAYVDGQHDLYRSHKALPLIVLAGLR